jgi:hypothetical protein
MLKRGHRHLPEVDGRHSVVDVCKHLVRPYSHGRHVWWEMDDDQSPHPGITWLPQAPLFARGERFVDPVGNPSKGWALLCQRLTG